MRPNKLCRMMLPQMQEMEKRQHRRRQAALPPRSTQKQRQQIQRASRRRRELDAPPANPRSRASPIMLLIHMIEMLSWGDAGIYLCIPGGALAGAAVRQSAQPNRSNAS
jgi:hypothetical protein